MKQIYGKIYCVQCKYLINAKEQIFYAASKPHCCQYCQNLTIENILLLDENFDKPHFWNNYFNIYSYIK